MVVQQKLTRINYTPRNSTLRVRYIVIHFVGSVSTAKNNADYFYSEDRGASAHYFVDEAEIWQVVADGDIAWHCGASKYVHPNCRNTNSIGIELCCKKDAAGQWYFQPETVAWAQELTRELMAKYNVPMDNIVRHYDVTGKNCPEPYVRDPQAWEAFKEQLGVAQPSVEDCTQDMLWRGIIADKKLWDDIARQDEDVRWLLVKYYAYIRKNGGSVKNPNSLAGTAQAVEILNKQGILSEPGKWTDKAADGNIYWLLLKMADYIC